METAITNSTPSDVSEASNAPPEKQAGKEAALPKLSGFERAIRLISLPASLAVAYSFFDNMSRAGIRDFFHEHKWFKKLEDEIAAKLQQAGKGERNDSNAVYKRTGEITKEFEEGADKIMKDKGFTNSFKYFVKNESRQRLNILLTTGAAFSVTLGFFAMIAEPRNRAAITELFHKVNKHAEQKDSPQR